MLDDFDYMAFYHMCFMVACVEMSPYRGGQVLCCWCAALDFIQVLFEPFFETSFGFSYILFVAVCASQYINHIGGFAVLWGMKCVLLSCGCASELSISVLESFTFLAREVPAFEVLRFDFFGGVSRTGRGICWFPLGLVRLV